MSRTFVVAALAGLALAAAGGGVWWWRSSGGGSALRNGDFESGLDGWTARGGVRAARGDDDRGVVELPAPRGGESALVQDEVRLRRAGTYEITVRARGSGAPTLELWAARRTDAKRSDRLRAGVWTRVPGEWTELRAQWTTAKEGDCRFELIARPGDAPVPGLVTIDEVTIREVAVADAVDVTRGEGFDDAPSLVRATDGSFWVSHLRRDEAGESLRAARFVAEGRTFRRDGGGVIEQGPGTAVLDPRLVAGPDGVVAVYAVERGDDWRVAVTRVAPAGGNGPSGPPVGAAPLVELGTPDATDVRPAAAFAPDGTLWVAWESNRGGERQTWIAPVKDGRAGAAERLGSDGLPSRSPSVAATAGGRVAVAWHAVADGNTDIHLRVRSPSGVWGPDRRVTSAPTMDRNAVLFVRKRVAKRGDGRDAAGPGTGADDDELWLVWENARGDGPRTTRVVGRRLWAARVTDDALLAPAGWLDAAPVAKSAEAAAPAFDDTGRLRLGFARPRRVDAGWQAWIATWTGDAWSESVAVSSRKGMDRAPSLVLDGMDAVVAIQTDDLCTGWSDIDRTPEARSQILLARVALPEAPAVQHALVPLAEAPEPYESGDVRRANGDLVRAAETANVGDEDLRLLFGNLHEHSDVSICDRLNDDSVGESWQALRDQEGLDFGAVTDHGENFNAHLWAGTSKEARANDDPGRFVTFLGEEWASSFEATSDKYPYGYYGHRNVVLADLRCPRWWNPRDGSTPADLWADLRKLGGDFAVIPHQLADTGNVPTDWSFTDETAQPVAEVFQIRGSYEGHGAPRAAEAGIERAGWYLQDAFAKGIVIGVIASPDHGGGWGKCCVWARDLSRKGVLDALRARRTYGTTGARIVLDVRVNDRFMGVEDTAPAAQVAVRVRVSCPQAIARIEVCRDGVFHEVPFPPGLTADVAWTDPSPPPRRTWTYVRVRQANGQIAWSSPVWLGPR